MLNKRLRLYPRAITDLEDIYLYGVGEFGLEKAESYIKNIEVAFQNVANTPDISRKCDHIRSGLLAWNVESHVIFLKKTKTTVTSRTNLTLHLPWTPPAP